MRGALLAVQVLILENRITAILFVALGKDKARQRTSIRAICKMSGVVLPAMWRTGHLIVALKHCGLSADLLTVGRTSTRMRLRTVTPYYPYGAPVPTLAIHMRQVLTSSHLPGHGRLVESTVCGLSPPIEMGRMVPCTEKLTQSFLS
jgi:hypothetical protein